MTKADVDVMKAPAASAATVASEPIARESGTDLKLNCFEFLNLKTVLLERQAITAVMTFAGIVLLYCSWEPDIGTR